MKVRIPVCFLVCVIAEIPLSPVFVGHCSEQHTATTLEAKSTRFESKEKAGLSGHHGMILLRIGPVQSFLQGLGNLPKSVVSILD